MKDTQVQKLRSDARRKLAAGEVTLEEVKSLWLDEERAAAENRAIRWTDQRIANILAYAAAIVGENEKDSLDNRACIFDEAIRIAYRKLDELDTELREEHWELFGRKQRPKAGDPWPPRLGGT